MSPKEAITAFDAEVLAVLREVRGSEVSYVLANKLRMKGMRDLNTSRVRAALDRLVAAGSAERMPQRFSRMHVWKATPVSPAEMTAADLDEKFVEVTDPNHEMCGFRGEARDDGEHGWISVHLDAVDETDNRVIQHLLPEQVTIVENA